MVGDGGGSTPDFCFPRLKTSHVLLLIMAFSRNLYKDWEPLRFAYSSELDFFCLRWLFLLTPIAAVYRIHKSIFFAFFYFVKFKSQHINKIFTLKPLTVFREVHNGNVPQTKKRGN